MGERLDWSLYSSGNVVRMYLKLFRCTAANKQGGWFLSPVLVEICFFCDCKWASSPTFQMRRRAATSFTSCPAWGAATAKTWVAQPWTSLCATWRATVTSLAPVTATTQWSDPTQPLTWLASYRSLQTKAESVSVNFRWNALVKARPPCTQCFLHFLSSGGRSRCVGWHFKM